MSPQQISFFVQNGYIELEGLSFDPVEIFSAAKMTSVIQPFGRDLWRKNESLHKLLMRKLSSAIFHLIAKPLRLACDQWISFQTPDQPCSVNDLFCIQGLVLSVFFIASEIPPFTRRPAALGIPPFPRHPKNILFVKPHIVLDWPLLLKSPADLYCAAYMFPNHGVYIHNPQDPATHLLKQFGYAFGDTLAKSHHPLLIYHG